MHTTIGVAFSSHLLRYVGVGLISGSIVHAGTLGGSNSRYTTLIICGIVAFAVGVFLEERERLAEVLGPYVALSVIVSVGTGMIGGGIQHFTDGPNFAAILIPLGFCIALLSYMFRDYRTMFSLRYVCVITLGSVLAWLVFQQVAQLVPAENHRSGEVVGTEHRE
jgi:hypothetical protein